jgi:transketolase N-terminal domain/subunit
MKPNTQQLNDLTIQVRRDILQMVHAVNSGHPGGSLGCAEFLVVLYQNIMDRKEGFEMDRNWRRPFSFKRAYFSCWRFGSGYFQ